MRKKREEKKKRGKKGIKKWRATSRLRKPVTHTRWNFARHNRKKKKDIETTVEKERNQEISLTTVLKNVVLCGQEME